MNFRKELAIYLSFFTFIKPPFSDGVPEDVDIKSKLVLKTTLLLAHTCVWVIAYIALTTLIPEEVLASLPGSTTVAIFLTIGILALVIIGNATWVWFVRGLKIGSEKSIVSIIRYFR